MKHFLPFLCLIFLLTGCQKPIDEASDTRFLMDTVCTIVAGGGNANGALQEAFDAVKEIQDAVNRFDENSTVARFNRAKAGEAVALDRHTASILKTALAVSKASGGAFDITIAPASSLWDFHAENPIPPSEESMKQVLALIGYDKLILDTDKSTLTKTQDGVAIDLGGAAKGYAADYAAEVLRQAGLDYALLNFGGNVYVFGKNPNRKDGSWQVGIQKPFADSGRYSRTISIAEGAVVTSGIYQRNFTYDDKLYHHILDPKTGYPTDGALAGVTIQADSALLADCLSTACLVLGEEQGKAVATSFDTLLYAEKK